MSNLPRWRKHVLEKTRENGGKGVLLLDAPERRTLSIIPTEPYRERPDYWRHALDSIFPGMVVAQGSTSLALVEPGSTGTVLVTLVVAGPRQTEEEQWVAGRDWAWKATEVERPIRNLRAALHHVARSPNR